MLHPTLLPLVQPAAPASQADALTSALTAVSGFI